MHALVFTGFLGTGKTTLLLAVVDRLIARGERVAIIENERGSIGIDGAYLEAQGLNVREIRAGCVCCDLTQPLRWTVEELRRRFRPDWLLLEASGVAHADALRTSLRHPEMAGIDWKFVALIDVARFGKLWSEQYGIGMLVRPQVAQADLLVLTKVDTVNRDRLFENAVAIEQVRPDIPILPFAVDEPAYADAIVQAIEEVVCTKSEARPDELP